MIERERHHEEIRDRIKCGQIVNEKDLQSVSGKKNGEVFFS
jgi:hypothetical protein